MIPSCFWRFSCKILFNSLLFTWQNPRKIKLTLNLTELLWIRTWCLFSSFRNAYIQKVFLCYYYVGSWKNSLLFLMKCLLMFIHYICMYHLLNFSCVEYYSDVFLLKAFSLITNYNVTFSLLDPTKLWVSHAWKW
jgi:hypothetical protein